MMRRLETLGKKINCPVFEMCRTIGHQATRHSVVGAPVDDGMSGVFRIRVRKLEKPLVVRMDVAQHPDVLVAAVAWPMVNVVELHEIVRFHPVSGRAKWAWYFIPSKGRLTVNACPYKGLEVVCHGWPVVLRPKGASSDVATAMTGRAIVRDDAQSQMQFGNVLGDLDLAVSVVPKTVHANQVVRLGR